MRIHRWGLIALLACLACAETVQAHFLFLRLRPPAEGGRFAEVYFSDQADAGDPRFIDKIASTKLWMQTKPGIFEPLTVHKAADRLRALVPARGGVAVIGECTYGVLGKETPFLLRHYPKAIAGTGKDGFKRKQEIPFEIDLREVADGLEFVAMRNGKPVPNAVFEAVGAGLKGHKFKANASGEAVWKPATAGHYAVYTSETLKESGTHQGTKYTEIREFATLSFAWPLQASGADEKAVALFQEAMNARASWSDFPGFSAAVNANVDGRKWKGTATISAKGDVELSMEDDVATPWIKEQLESLAMHRIARPQGKPPIVRFADDERDHPLGRLLTFEGGSFASSYRVKDRQLMVVNRALKKTNMTITILENDTNADKKFLPRSYTVQYWNAQSGALDRTETIQNRWTRLGSWDLPTQLTVTTASGLGHGVKTMTLSGHVLLKVKAAVEAQEFDPKVIDAWQKAGAKVGSYRQGEFHQRSFPIAKSNADALPLFALSLVRGVITNLPEPPMPFALSLGGGVKDARLHEVAGLKNLRALVLNRQGVTDAGMKHLAALKELQTLDLSENKITDAGAKELAGLKKLQHLNISESNVTDTGLKELSALDSLETLILYRTGITDEGLKGLARLKNLRTLSLNDTKVTDAGIEHIAALKNLEYLDLSKTQITEAGLKRLAGLPKLTTLDFRYNKVTDACLKEMAALKSLRALDITHTMQVHVKLEPTGLKELAAHANLQVLKAGGTGMTDAGLKELAALRNLHTLDIYSTEVTDAGLKELARFKNLRDLKLMWMKQLTKAGMKEEGALTNLQVLNLGVTDTTDAGLKELAGLKNLQSLSLSSTKVTDPGMKHLAGLNNLQSLDLSGTQVTDIGLKELTGLAGLNNLRILTVSLGQPITMMVVDHLRVVRPGLQIKVR